MFWRRATAWGGFFSLVAGTAAAYITNRLNAYHTVFHFGSATLSASFWQAIIAFITMRRCRAHPGLAGHQAQAQRGAPWAGLGAGRRARRTRPRSTLTRADKLWWRFPPWLLAGVKALAMLVVLNIIFA